MMSDKDLREEVTETRALRDMDANSTVKKVVCSTDFVFDFTAKWNDGIAVMGGSDYRTVSRSWNVSRDEVDELHKSADINKWINNIKQEVSGETFLTDYKNVKGDVHPVANLHYLIEFINGETTWLKQTLKINSTSHFSQLVSSAFSDHEVFVEPSSEKSTVQFGSQKIEMLVEEPTHKKQSQLDNIIKDYLSRDRTSVRCRIRDVQEIEEDLRVCFETDRGYEYNLTFLDPTDNRSDIWDLVGEFGYTDPWNLEGEQAYYTVAPIGGSNMYNHDYVNISSEEVERGRIKQTKLNIIDRIGDFF